MASRCVLWLLAASCLASSVGAQVGAQRPRTVRAPRQRTVRLDAEGSEAPDEARRGAGDVAGVGDDVAGVGDVDGSARRLAATVAPTPLPTEALPFLDQPILTPPSGPVASAVAVSFLHPRMYGARGVMIHYTLDGSEPTRQSPMVRAGALLHVTGTYSLNITVRAMASVQVFQGEFQRFRDSADRVVVYEVQMGKYDFDRKAYSGRVGMAFLVPYFYGRHFIDSLALGVGVASTHSSKVARVDLMTSTYRSVRIHGVETDFGEYYDFDMRDGLRYQRGTAAYAGQVHTHDVAEYAGEPDARGFFDGFVHERTLRSQTDLETVAYRYALRETVSAEALASMALAKEDVGICTVESFQDPVDRKVNRTEYVTTSYGFLAPFYNGHSYSGKAVRLELNSLRVKVELYRERHNQTRCCTVNGTMEFCAAVFKTGPYFELDGAVELETTDLYGGDSRQLTQVVDMAATHDALRGFVGGFSCGKFAYFVPHFDGTEPGHRIARLDAETLDAVEFVDLRDFDATLGGFFGGFAYETFLNGASYETRGAETPTTAKAFGFLVPHRSLYTPVGGADAFASNLGGDETVPAFHGKVVRMDLDRFGLGGSVDVLDLSRIDADLRGFAGAAVVGRFAIIVPYKNRDVEDGYFGKVVKIDLETFAVVAVLDLTQYAVRSKTSDVAGANLVGFVGGIAWGKYAVLVPHRNAKRLPKNNMRPHSALAVRIDVEDFTLSGVAVIDLAHVERQQVPSQPDNELRGFLHGFAQGEYLYLVPHFSRDFYGKLVRIDMRDFTNLAALQAADQSTLVAVGTPGAWTGVQYVDLERSDRQLVGFSGGFSVRSAHGAHTRVLSTPRQKGAWWDAAQAKEPRDADEPPTRETSAVRHVLRTALYEGCSGWAKECLLDSASTLCLRCAFLRGKTAVSMTPELYMLVD